MRALGRLVLGGFALLLAVTAGGVALTLALLFDPGANAWLTQGALAGLDAAFGDMAAGLPPESVLMLVAGLAKALFLLLFVPPVVVATAGEVMGRRSLLWYGGGCGLLTALLPWLVRGSPRPGSPGVAAAEARLTLILFVVGASAGLVYWLVAGRSAGRTDGPAPT
ncbi:hypothetical protein [Methylobacterium aerolatum]|uniref:Uncharacterized protein n=1 Tax=Methylobacterium aerolatum TaxID=418708 RepID=A0ABU0HVD9_9HYPH|nr:hypothetical protein [Methylobacterium aerolatum]MDQ0445783.1 hypothetical protein [Methylobacterium aerolatum]GJD35956.1 hypothetical protein FMGBMHLM_2870 [Methylobacterium aerolatum]